VDDDRAVSCGHNRQLGATSVLEAVLALVVAGLALGTAVPFYRGYLADRSLQNAAHLLQSDIRFAQQAAIARAGSGPQVELCFRQDGYDIYAVTFDGDPLQRTGAVPGPTLKVVNAGGEYPSEVRMVPETTATDPCLRDGTRRALVFSGAGMPVSFDDTSTKDVTLTLRGRTYRVRIAPTGRATVVR
jgi:type II secretory pathway pseudopilin PulG